MLPTKGYFQDIECPFYNTTCGRPYCHFRHKRKPNESVEETVQDTSKNVIPTYKPTPKSELANIQNSKSHIPISYVPDLAFKRERTVRPIRIEKPTYKPTPLSILSSATKPESSLPENHELKDTIKNIQEKFASNTYDPLKSEIDFEDLSNEFELIDDIINNSEESENVNLIETEHIIEKEQTTTSFLQTKVDNKDNNLKKSSEDSISAKFSSDEDVKSETKTTHLKNDIKKDKDEPKISKEEIKGNKKDDNKTSHKDKSQSLDKSKEDTSSSRQHESQKTEKHTSKSHKSTEQKKHHKEEKKDSSKKKVKEKRKHKSKDRSKSPKEKKSDTKRPKNKSESTTYSSDSSPVRHRKEKKSDSSKLRKSHKDSHSKSKKKKSSRSRSRSSSKSKHKSKKRSRSKSQTRHKEDKSSKSSKDRSKDRSKSSSKSKERSKDKSTSSSSKEKSHEDKKSKRKISVSSHNSSSDHDNDVEMNTELIPSDIDLDLEDEDETMRECYKIFNEYKPQPLKPDPIKEDQKMDIVEEENNAYYGKKRTAHAGAEVMATYSKLPNIAPPKPTPLPGQVLANRYRIAKVAQANNEQQNIMNEVKSITQPVKRPAMSLLEAARLHKMRRMQRQKAAEKEKSNASIVDDILNGVHRPSPSQVKVAPKKIAAVPNVALIEKAKERLSLVKQQRLQNLKTVAQNQKGGPRVAHVPEYTLAEIPDVLQADKSKLPVNVRTRFLTMIADECSKLYALKDDAFNRALNEEFACYEKCKVLATYRNSAMLAVNRLRKEFQERESKGLGPLLSGEAPLNKKESDFEGKRFYDHMKRWVLTEEELDIHGYPRESEEKGKAIINNRTEIDYSLIDENQRKCSRCGRVYQVDDDGWVLFEEECMYHPLKKRTIRGEQVFLCCKSNDDTGCATSDTHVYDGSPKHHLEGYQATLPPESDNDPRSTQVYALDCEMCYTTKGLELTRVTIVDKDCKTVYESFVKPLNPIIDYNTRFSGITKEQMDRTSTSILQVQANILHLCNSETILVGHSLESDMKALKIVHSTIIDTSVLFPHKMGLPHKRALRALASEYLKKIIQNDVAGHDSAEDAVTCMDLIKWKLKEELKVKTK